MNRADETIRRALAVYQVAQQVGFPLLLGAAGYFFLGLRDHEVRLARIEENRYTVSAARVDRDLATRERGELKELIIRLDERLRGLQGQ